MKEKLLQILDKWGCHHKWVILKNIDSYSYASDKFPSSFIDLYTCQKCGEFKKIKL